jgi:hypothetical protein
MSYDDEDAGRKWAQAQRRRDEASRMSAIGFGILLLLIGAGLAAWLFWGYLQTGSWPTMTARSLFGWSFASEMVGLQNIVNWFLDQWIGVYPLGLGILIGIGASNNDW